MDVLVWNHIHDQDYANLKHKHIVPNYLSSFLNYINNSQECPEEVEIVSTHSCNDSSHEERNRQAKEQVSSWLSADVVPSLVVLYYHHYSDDNSYHDLKEIISILKPFVEQRGGHVLIQSVSSLLSNNAMKHMVSGRKVSRNDDDANDSWTYPHFVHPNGSLFSTYFVSVKRLPRSYDDRSNNTNCVPLRHVGRWIFGESSSLVESYKQELNNSETKKNKMDMNRLCTEEISLWNWCFPLFKIGKISNWSNDNAIIHYSSQNNRSKAKKEQEQQWGMFISKTIRYQEENNKNNMGIFDIVLHLEVPFCTQTIFSPNIIMDQQLPIHLWQPLLQFMALAKERDPKKKYPKLACMYMHRLYEYGDVQHFFNNLSTQQQELWMSLQDSFHHIQDLDPTDYTTSWTRSSYCKRKNNQHDEDIEEDDFEKNVLPVCVDKMNSPYHGYLGHVVRFPSSLSQDTTHSNENYHVQLWARGPYSSSILPTIQISSPSQLKTLGGISRTNAFESSGLYSDISRINHSCQPNVIKLPLSKYYQLHQQHNGKEDLIKKKKKSSKNKSIETHKRKWFLNHLYLKKYPIPKGTNQFQTFWEKAHVIVPTSLSSLLEKDEQLFIDYGCSHETNLQYRRDWLEIKYGFQCHCQRCLGQQNTK